MLEHLASNPGKAADSLGNYGGGLQLQAYLPIDKTEGGIKLVI